MEELTWQEAIRKRPGMYLGIVNHKGFVDAIKGVLSELILVTKSNCVNLTFTGKNKGSIVIDNVSRLIPEDIATIKKGKAAKIDLPVLNALSKEFQIEFKSKSNLIQKFSEGKTNHEIGEKEIECSQICISYKLDHTIWGSNFIWKTNYISYELREFSYLNSKVRFNITEQTANSSNTNSYQFKNGIADRLEIEIFNGHGKCYFQHHIKKNFENFDFEIAFAFREYTVDQGFIRTVVNNEITPENGTHLDGVLNGLTYGVMKYFQANCLIEKFKISEKGMKEGLLCIINLKMENPIYSGCVKNKLANPEIIEPIASLISEEFYGSILDNQESTQKIISKFKIGKV